MPELEQIKMRLNLRPEELPRHNRYPQPQRPIEAVQTSLTALPGLDWSKFSQQPMAPVWTGCTSNCLDMHLHVPSETV